MIIMEEFKNNLNTDKNFLNIALLLSAGYKVSNVGGYIKNNTSDMYVELSGGKRSGLFFRNQPKAKITLFANESNFEKVTRQNIENTISLLNKTFNQTCTRLFNRENYFNYMSEVLSMYNTSGYPSLNNNLNKTSLYNHYVMANYSKFINNYSKKLENFNNINVTEYFNDVESVLNYANLELKKETNSTNNFYYLNTKSGVKQFSGAINNYEKKNINIKNNNAVISDSEKVKTLNALNSLYNKIEDYLINYDASKNLALNEDNIK